MVWHEAKVNHLFQVREEEVCLWAFHGAVLSMLSEDDPSNPGPLALAQAALLPTHPAFRACCYTVLAFLSATSALCLQAQAPEAHLLLSNLT